ncbi:MAG: VanZ family protein [Gammaproteobacteria bacterium]|nr:VanZ family protein [Gammaproteobacteria bacterium]
MIGFAVLVLFAAGVLLCVGLWTRHDGWLLRAATLLMVAVLLLGMLLPASAIDVLREAVMGLFGDWVEDAPGPSKAIWAHLMLFTATGLLVGRLRQHFGWGRVLGFLLVLAVMTEAMQFFSPGRHPSLMDVGANLLGISVGLALLATLMWLGARLGVALGHGPEAERIGSG